VESIFFFSLKKKKPEKKETCRGHITNETIKISTALVGILLKVYIIKDFFPRHFDIHRFNREKEERRQRGLLFCTHTTKTTTTIFSPRLSVSIVYTSREKKKNPNLIV
jgi:hypothetical protein